KYLYVIDGAGASISGFSFASADAPPYPSAMWSVATRITQPKKIHITKYRTCLFVAGGGSVDSYTIDFASGSLTSAMAAPVTLSPGTGTVKAIASDTLSNWLYVTMSGGDILGYTIGASCGLTPMPSSPFPGGDAPTVFRPVLERPGE